MSAAVKTRPIEQPIKRKSYLLSFRLSTPRRFFWTRKKDMLRIWTLKIQKAFLLQKPMV